MKRFLNARVGVIAANIKNTRLERNYTQEYLSAKLKIPLHDYSELELGKTELTLNRLFHIAEILNVPILELIEKDSALLTGYHTKSDSSHFTNNS